jgi:hypothetical protein
VGNIKEDSDSRFQFSLTVFNARQETQTHLFFCEDESLRRVLVHYFNDIGAVTLQEKKHREALALKEAKEKADSMLHRNMFAFVKQGKHVELRDMLTVSLPLGDPILDRKNTQGLTALMVAVLENRHACLQVLLEHEANLTLKNDSGKDVLIMAAEMGSLECLDVFLSTKVKIDVNWLLDNMITNQSDMVIKRRLIALKNKMNAATKAEADQLKRAREALCTEIVSVAQEGKVMHLTRLLTTLPVEDNPLTSFVETFGKNAIMCLVEHGRHTDDFHTCLRLLLQHGATVVPAFYHQAFNRDRDDAISLLIKKRDSVECLTIFYEEGCLPVERIPELAELACTHGRIDSLHFFERNFPDASKNCLLLKRPGRM